MFMNSPAYIRNIVLLIFKFKQTSNDLARSQAIL